MKASASIPSHRAKLPPRLSTLARVPLPAQTAVTLRPLTNPLRRSSLLYRA